MARKARHKSIKSAVAAAEQSMWSGSGSDDLMGSAADYATGAVSAVANVVKQVPVVGPPVADAVNMLMGTVSSAVTTVTGGRGRGRPKLPRRTLTFLKGGRISKATKRRLLALHSPNIRRKAFGRVMINPVNGNISSLIGGALGAGLGYVVAQKVVPGLVGRFVPAAAQGLIGVAVGALGGMAIGRVVGKKSAKLGNAIALGSMVALGVGLVGAVIRLLPSSVTSAVPGLAGMRGMRDYLQLSGPVSPSLFAGGLNGMGDFVNFGGAAAGQVAEAQSAAITEWTPSANEGF